MWLELKRREVAVPRQCSLVSYDDARWMRMVEPGVTAVRQPVFAMGVSAAELLLERVRRGGVGRTVSDVLQPELVVRDSSSPPRG